MRSIKTQWTILALACCLLPFSGCAERLKTTISVYHTLPDGMPRMNYAFVPLKNQENNNENLAYRDRIRAALLKHRLVETDVDNASLLVSFSYGIDNGRERAVDELFDSRTITEYRRGLWVYVFDKNRDTNEPGDMLYEGGALSAGEAMQLSSVMPAMIRALFREFPGKSGTRRIEYISP